MGYRIQYEPELNKHYPAIIKKQANKKALLYASGFAILFMLISIPVCRQWIWEFLIPGDAHITVDAFSQMIYQIKHGTAISDAVTTFCQEILAYA